MMRSFLFASMILLFMQTKAQKNISSFIPDNYHIHQDGKAKGDLNKDGISDLALVVYHGFEDSVNHWEAEHQPSRMLIILLGEKDGYRLAASTSNAILCKDCGGIFGDPFAGLEIKNQVLSIYHYGGSNWRWSLTHKFRYQQNDWYLIGKTTHSNWIVKECEELGDLAGTDYEDVNLVTGQYEVKKISEDCKLIKKEKGKRKVEPLLSLTKFNIDN